MSTSIPKQTNRPELEYLTPLLNQDASGWSATFQGLTLKSALQPIFSIAHKRTIGYEALIRPFKRNLEPVSPFELFQMPSNQPETLLLDRLCRYLHVKNFATQSDSLNWLFLNVSPSVASSGSQRDSFFGQLLEQTGFPPHRVVVEIVEQPSDDPDRLRETAEYYKRLGCLTALDDFGAGHSNFERVWNLKPDIVKLDRMLLARATNDRRASQILRGMTALLHQSGCLVLLEGVEEKEQALLAIDSGVDFVQGFFFARPDTNLPEIIHSTTELGQLLRQHKHRQTTDLDPLHELSKPFVPLFQRAIAALSGPHDFQRATDELMAQPDVSRCYLINREGIQVADTQCGGNRSDCFDPRFRPLQSTHNADWYRQQYLQQALREPGSIQVSAPYLSMTGGYMCKTLSLAFPLDGETHVICCDVLDH